MADEKPRRKRSESEEDSGADAPRRGSRRRRSSGTELAQRARRELAEITGFEPEGVSALERAEDGTWRVTVELLELSRIPNTDDVIGSYEAEFDDGGELIGYRRVRRYVRSQASEEERVEGSR